MTAAGLIVITIGTLFALTAWVLCAPVVDASYETADAADSTMQDYVETMNLLKLCYDALIYVILGVAVLAALIWAINDRNKAM